MAEVSSVVAGAGKKVSSDEESIVTNSIDKESEDMIVAAVIRGVMESSVTNQERSVGQVATRPAHGSRIGTSAVSYTHLTLPTICSV